MNHREFYLYAGYEKCYKELTQRKFIVDKKLKALSFENAYVLPVVNFRQQNIGYGLGGVVDHQGNYVESSARYRGKGKDLLPCTMIGQYEFDKEKCPLIEEECIYCGDWMEHYGHFLCEGTTRLWYALDHYRKGVKLIFLSEKKRQISGNFKAFFELLGIDLADVVILTQVSLCRHIIVPDVSSVLCQWATKEFYLPFKKITDAIKTKNYKRIYLSRGHFKSRAIIGEETCENLFKENGFKVVYPEEVSLKELVAYLKGAEYVAGLAGTGLHNILFASPNTKLIHLNRSSFANPAQELINQAIGIDVFYVDVHYNFLASQLVFFIGLTEPLRKMAQKFLFKVNMTSQISLDQVKLYIQEYLKAIRTEQAMYLPDSGLGDVFNEMIHLLSLPEKRHFIIKCKYYLFSKFCFGKTKKKYQKRLFNMNEKR